MNMMRMLSFFPNDMDVEAITVNPVLPVTLYVQMDSSFGLIQKNLGWSIIHNKGSQMIISK